MSTEQEISVIKNEAVKLVDKFATHERCQEHFAELLKADVMTRVNETETKPNTNRYLSVSFCPSVSELNANIQKLRNKKAPGPDGLSNELLRTAGFPLAALMHQLLQASVRTVWLPQNSGGKRFGKRKAAPLIASNTCGVGLSNVFTGTLQHYLNPFRAKTVPPMPCGAVAGRGTDFAHHLPLATVDAAAMKNCSAF